MPEMKSALGDPAPAGQKYIPLSEIAYLTPYTAEYLAMLAGRGQLKAVLEDGVWYTTMEWVNEYVVWLNNQMEAVNGGGSYELRVNSYEKEENVILNPSGILGTGSAKRSEESQRLPMRSFDSVPQSRDSAQDDALQTSRNLKLETGNFLSLQEAEQVSPYSADYLSLRIRQGKLQGKKKAGKWYTTLDWVNEYIAQHAAPVVEQPVFTPAPVQTPAIASEPELILETPLHFGGQAITNNQTPRKLQTINNQINNYFLKFWNLMFSWLLEIGVWCLKQTENLKHLVSTKLFQRVTAASLIALLLAVSFSNDSVRASFHLYGGQVADWSREARLLGGQVATTVRQTAVTVTSNIAQNSSVMLEQVRRTTDSIHLANRKLDSIASSLGFARDSLQNDIASSLASISLPDISLPSISLPHVSIPEINLPRFALPDFHIPSFSIPDISLPRLAMPNISLLDINLPSLTLPHPDFSRLTQNITSNLSVILEGAKRPIGSSISNLVSKMDSIASSRLWRDSLQNDKTTEPTQGLVLGEAVTRTDLPVSPAPSFLSQSVTAFSQSFKDIVSFLNPSSPDSLLSRLSGTASEIGSALGTQADPLTRAASTVTTFFSQINPGKILQPAGSFIARLKPAPAENNQTPITNNQENINNQTSETEVSGEITLQPAASLAGNNQIAAQAPVIRYVTRPSTAPASSGSLTVSVPATASSASSYFTITDPNTIQTAKTIHALSGLISDSLIITKSLTVATGKTTLSGLEVLDNAVFQKNLSVSGDTTLSNLNVQGTLTAANFNPQSLTTSSLAADYISTKTITATGSLSGSSFSGQFGSFTNLASNSASFGGNNNDTFLSKSPSTFESTLSVTGAATLASTLALTGAATLSSTLAVTGASTLTGNTTIGGTLAVTGASTFTGALTANGGITLTGALTTSATSTASAFVSTSSSATSTLAGNLQVNGSLTNYSLLTTNYLSATSTTATSTLSTGGLAIGTNQFVVQQTSGYIGIATSTPAYLADINGAFRVGLQGSATDYLLFANTVTNRVGIGTSTPGALFAVAGNSLFDGSLSTFGQLTASYFTATSTTATSTIATGGFTVGTNQFVVQQTSGYIGVASTSPWGLLSVEQGTEEASFVISNQASSTPSFYVSGTNQDGRVGIGTSTPSALLTVQEDNTTGHIVYFTDANTVTPTFRIAATTGDIETRGDFTQGARKDLATLSNINDVFIYDTTKDADGGAWTRNDQAQASSWYNETLDATAQSCNISTNDRCGRKEFPEKAILVGTNDYLYIFDAKDNSMWMRFDEGAGNQHIGGESHNITSIFALNGSIYVGKTLLGNVDKMNFIEDASYLYHETGGLGKRSLNISGRNSSQSVTYIDASLTPISSSVNDVSAAVICGGGVAYNTKTTPKGMVFAGANLAQKTPDLPFTNYDSTTNKIVKASKLPGMEMRGIEPPAPGMVSPVLHQAIPMQNSLYQKIKNLFTPEIARAASQSCKTYIAVATDSGVSLINEDDQIVIDFDVNSADDINDVYLTSNGTLYYDTETAQTINVFKNAHLKTSDVTSGSADITYSATSQPAIFTSAQTINDIFVLDAPSPLGEGWGEGRTVLIAHNAGLTKLSENTASSTLSSVKYYQTGTTTEEMIGDIRGMWPFVGTAGNTIANGSTTGLSDASIKANSGTASNANGTGMAFASGVRGVAVDLDGTDDYIDITDNDNLSFGDQTADKAFSISAWAKMDDATNFRFFAKGSLAAREYLFFTRATDVVSFELNDNDTSNKISIDGSALTSYEGQWIHLAATYDGSGSETGLKLYLNGTTMSGTQTETGTYIAMHNQAQSSVIGRVFNDGTTYSNGYIDEVMITAQALTPSQIKYMYEVGKKALENHTASKITGISGADSYQELYGASDIVKSISVDLENNLMYVGTSDGSDGGGVSAIGLQSDTIEDIWGSDALKTDDDGTAWNADDIVSVSVSGRYPRTLVIGTDTELWEETESFSFDKYRSQSQNPHGEHLVQTNLTVNQDLAVGNSFTVYGKVLGASVGNRHACSLQDGNCERPTFQVAADGTISVRDDLILNGHTNLQSLSSINDVFVYDTTKDTDGGAWTNDSNAKASSWYNEPIDATSQTCDIINNDRCGNRAFPQKAIIIGVGAGSTGSLYIFDAKDNTLWMRFDHGGSWPSVALFDSTTANISSVYALNGKIYAGTTVGNGVGLVTADFIADTGFQTYNTITRKRIMGLGSRNTAEVSPTYSSTLNIINATVNDVSVAVINNKTYVAVATDGGVSLINETDGIVVDFYYTTTFAYGDAVYLLNNGDMYYNRRNSGSTNITIYVKYSAHTYTSDQIPSTGAMEYHPSGYASASNPAYLGPAGLSTAINDIYAIQGTSFIDGKSNTIYVATSGGLAKISEKQGDETNGAVKYYTQDYISEEMVGDIRGMWTFGEGSMLDDVSVKTNGLTAASITTADLVDGVRGTGISGWTTSKYLSCADATCTNLDAFSVFSLGVWMKSTSISTQQTLISKFDAQVSGDQAYLLDTLSSKARFITTTSNGNVNFSGNTTLSSNQWYHIVTTYDGNTVKLYINGVLDGSSSQTGTIQNVSEEFYIGVAENLGMKVPMVGTIDEPFVTAEVLSPSQIKYMYDTGKRALEQKALSTTSDATAVGNDRLGDSGLAVTADDYIGSFIEINGGTGIGQTRRIVDNDTTTFYVDPPFDITPDTTSDFQILANQIYIKDSSTATTVQSIYVDKDAGIMYVGVNNGDNTGGITAIGLDSDNILDIWHNQAGKVDDLGNNWNADDIVAIGAASDGSPRHAELGSASGSRNEFGMTSGILAIATDAELWTQSSGQTLNALTSAASSPIKNVLVVKDAATFQGKFKITDGESQSILSIDESSKNINIREGIEFGSNTKLTNLSNINDIYVYDTSKDSDGGEWTCNDKAKGTSWYNEALNTSTRGKTKCFPRKAVIVAANTNFYIYDAKDNSLWMSFTVSQAVATGISNMLYFGVAGTKLTSDFALNGKIYLTGGGGASGYLHAIDFKSDNVLLYGSTTQWKYTTNIADRNSGRGLYNTGISTVPVSDNINDVHAAVINGKTYVAVATDGGVSVINETDGTVVDAQFSTTNIAYKTWLTSKGEMYALFNFSGGSNQKFLGAYYTIPTSDSTSGNNGARYAFSNNSGDGSKPMLLGENNFASIPTNGTPTVNGLYVMERTSSVDNISNTIYVASGTALNALNEKQGDETNSSIKYYTKDYISEELIGDIRGMWPMEGNSNGLADASVKAQTLTNNNAVTFNKAGVRGHAADFVAASSMSLTAADHADWTFTTAGSVGAWFYRDIDSGTYEGLITKWDNVDGADQSYRLIIYNEDTIRFETTADSSPSTTGPTVSTGQWYHVVGTYDGVMQRLYLNGVQVDADAQTGNLDDGAEAFTLGATSNTSAPTLFFDGKIDEPFLTAETLTPAQIKRMYETGKRALEGGTEGVASSATSAHSAFRVGVAAGAVKYSAGQFIGSIIQVYDGPGSATSTRFVTQTASSTADYYVQFSPDHSATIADSDTFSIGPNALQGSSNRVTAIAVDEYADFIYIGSTDATGVNGMVTKIALDSDTVTDVWHPTIGKTDDYKQPFATASTTAISIVDNTLAIGANDTNSGGFWSETAAESLDRKLTKPKTVFTVIDNIQTPRITSVTGNLTISSATSTSLTIGTATTTGATIQIKAGPSQNLLLSGDSNVGLYVSSAGNVGIGTTAPVTKLDIKGGATENTEIVVRSQATNKNAVIHHSDGTNEVYSGLLGAVSGGAGNWGVYAGSVRMVVTQDGNVGIGTTTPASLFDVQGDARANRYLVDYRPIAGRTVLADYSGGVSLSANTTAVWAFADDYVKWNISGSGSGWLNLGNGFILPKAYSGTMTFNTAVTAGAFAIYLQSSTDFITWTTLDTSADGATEGNKSYAFSSLAAPTALRFQFDNGNGTGVTDLTVRYIVIPGLDIGYSLAENVGPRLFMAGNVGIGTTTPGTKFTVNAGVGLFNSASDATSKNANSGLRLVAPISELQYNWMVGAQENVNAGFEITPSTAVGGATFSTPAVTILQSGSVGIGDSTPTEGTLVVGSAGAGSIYASFAAANSAALCFDGSGASLITDCTSGPSADYAEMYPVENNVEYGDIMMLGDAMVDTYSHDGNEVDWNKVLGQISKLKKATDASKMIGVLSNNRFDFSSTGYNIKDQDNPQPVALNGRIITKVNTENGAIKIGDYLTLSSTPGVAAKLKGSGYTIGRALSSYSGQGQGVILVFANLFYKSDVESFVPIWDGKIEGVVGEIKKLKEEDVKIKKRLEVIEKKIK